MALSEFEALPGSLPPVRRLRTPFVAGICFVVLVVVSLVVLEPLRDLHGPSTDTQSLGPSLIPKPGRGTAVGDQQRSSLWAGRSAPTPSSPLKPGNTSRPQWCHPDDQPSFEA